MDKRSKSALQTIRVAITGKTVGPPLAACMVALGEEEVQKRLQNAIKILNPDICPFPQWYLQQLKEWNIYGWMEFVKKKMQKDGSELIEIEYVYLKKEYSLENIWTFGDVNEKKL